MDVREKRRTAIVLIIGIFVCPPVEAQFPVELSSYWDRAATNLRAVRPGAVFIDWRPSIDLLWMPTEGRNESGIPGFKIESVSNNAEEIARFYADGYVLLAGYTKMSFDWDALRFRWRMHILTEAPDTITHEAQHLLAWATWPQERCPDNQEDFMYRWIGHGGPCDILARAFP